MYTQHSHSSVVACDNMCASTSCIVVYYTVVSYYTVSAVLLQYASSV
jgi:hypothetical protein